MSSSAAYDQRPNRDARETAPASHIPLRGLTLRGRNDGVEVALETNVLHRYGMTLIASAHNLQPGAVLRCRILGTSHKLTLKIADIEGGRLQAHFVRQNRKVVRYLAGESFRRHGISPKRLFEAGMPIKHIKDDVTFGIARSSEDFNRVLELRWLAYSQTDKLASYTRPQDFTDVYDSRSLILYAEHHGRVIASQRMIYNAVVDVFEHEQFAELPADFPPRDQIVEISRVCTHPDYRRTDLLVGLFQFGALVQLEQGRPWYLGCATDQLLPLYRRIGARVTDVEFRHEDLGGIKHTLIIANQHDAICGRTVNPVVWQVLGGHAFITEARRRNLLQDRDFATRFRLWLYKHLGTGIQAFAG